MSILGQMFTRPEKYDYSGLSKSQKKRRKKKNKKNDKVEHQWMAQVYFSCSPMLPEGEAIISSIADLTDKEQQSWDKKYSGNKNKRYRDTECVRKIQVVVGATQNKKCGTCYGMYDEEEEK